MAKKKTKKTTKKKQEQGCYDPTGPSARCAIAGMLAAGVILFGANHLIGKSRGLEGKVNDQTPVVQADESGDYENPQTPIQPQAPVKKQPKFEYHTVEKGENPWAIENKYNMKHGTLVELNDISPTTMDIGDKVKVSYDWGQVPEKPKDPNKLYYTIKSGDTLEGIEVKLGLKHGILGRGKNARSLKVDKDIIVGDKRKPNAAKMTNIFAKDADYMLLARLLFGEARGCTPDEIAQIAYTVENRTKDGVDWNGRNIREVLICEDKDNYHQYSCFNLKDANWKIVSDPEKYIKENPGNKEAWETCLEIAKDISSKKKKKKYTDKTQGATHYAIGKPYWADDATKIKMTASYDHNFWKGVQ